MTTDGVVDLRHALRHDRSECSRDSVVAMIVRDGALLRDRVQCFASSRRAAVSHAARFYRRSPRRCTRQAAVKAHSGFYSEILPLYDELPIPNMRGTFSDLMSDLLAAAHRVDAAMK